MVLAHQTQPLRGVTIGKSIAVFDPLDELFEMLEVSGLLFAEALLRDAILYAFPFALLFSLVRRCFAFCGGRHAQLGGSGIVTVEASAVTVVIPR